MNSQDSPLKGKGSGGKLSAFARRLAAEWRRLALPTDGRVVAAVSGGADSTALLLALAELLRAGRLAPEMLVVAHLDHGLRGMAGAEDALWVEELARRLGLESAIGRIEVKADAGRGRDNLEQAARRARYEFLRRTALARRAHVVVTAHTLDDQAETVLLALLRGSGAEGLGGMRPVRALDLSGGDLLLARPLLRWARRADTEQLCAAGGLAVRFDEMNRDVRFARVRVRSKLLPLLETFNPRIVEALGRTAELLSDDGWALEAEAVKLLEEARAEASGRPAEGGGGVAGEPSPVPPLRVEVLGRAPAALRRRALRLWIGRGRGGLRRLEMAHILAVEQLLTGPRGGRVAELPGGGRIERRQGLLLFRVKTVEKAPPGL